MIILAELQVVLVRIHKILFLVEASWVFVVLPQVYLGMKQKLFLLLRLVLLLCQLDYNLLNVRIYSLERPTFLEKVFPHFTLFQPRFAVLEHHLHQHHPFIVCPPMTNFVRLTRLTTVRGDFTSPFNHL